MQHENPQQPPQARMAPPSDTMPLDLQPQTSRWPGVIGIIAIVFGALGTLGGAMGVIGQVFAEQVSAMFPAEQRTAMESLKEWRTWFTLEQVLRLALGILLIVAGAKLIGRNATGARLCRTWAVLKLLVVVGTLILGWQTIDAQVEAAAQNTAMQQANISPETARVMFQFGLGLAALWGAALPVFLLIWFGRGSVKQEVDLWKIPTPADNYPAGPGTY